MKRNDKIIYSIAIGFILWIRSIVAPMNSVEVILYQLITILGLLAVGFTAISICQWLKQQIYTRNEHIKRLKVEREVKS